MIHIHRLNLGEICNPDTSPLLGAAVQNNTAAGALEVQNTTVTTVTTTVDVKILPPEKPAGQHVRLHANFAKKFQRHWQ